MKVDFFWNLGVFALIWRIPLPIVALFRTLESKMTGSGFWHQTINVENTCLCPANSSFYNYTSHSFPNCLRLASWVVWDWCFLRGDIYISFSKYFTGYEGACLKYYVIGEDSGIAAYLGKNNHGMVIKFIFEDNKKNTFTINHAYRSSYSLLLAGFCECGSSIGRTCAQ